MPFLPFFIVDDNQLLLKNRQLRNFFNGGGDILWIVLFIDESIIELRTERVGNLSGAISFQRTFDQRGSDSLRSSLM